MTTGIHLSKRFLLFLFFVYSFSCIEKSFAQGGVWTWMHGDTTIGNNYSIHGPPGQFDPSYRPVVLYERCSWKDKQGMFWLMANGDSLWKFDPSINQWAFIRGSGNYANYGVKGVSNPMNTPGERILTTLTWADTSGNLWLFGSYNHSYNLCADLWKFDVSTLEWTWISGSNIAGDFGNFGIQGIPSVNNYPSGRAENNTGWVDSSSNALWFYGGQTPHNMGSYGSYDLWKYEIATNEWTWMKGDTIGTLNPVFGTKGVPDPLNTPGTRCTYSKWTDNNGHFWLHGGGRFIPNVYFNDTWKYDISNNCWTWYNGLNNTSVGFALGNCFEYTANVPLNNYENKFNWKDLCGNFWLLSIYNLMWEFTPSTGNWNLTDGTFNVTTTVNFGIKGIPDTANHPFFSYGSETWTDNNGVFWYLERYQGTMWKFEPDLSCSGCSGILPVASFTSDSATICPGSCTSFDNLSLFANTYQWSFPGGIPDTSTMDNPQNICYANPGSYDVQLIASGATGSDTVLLPGYITVVPAPSPQGITQTGDTLFANSGGASYQWYYNGNMISGATDYFYVAMLNGDYNVLVTDSNGCEAEAVIFNVLTSVEHLNTFQDELKLYPDPAGEIIFIKWNSSFDVSYEISVLTLLGQEVISGSGSDLDQLSNNGIDISHLSTGMYFLEIHSKGYSARIKFVKK